MEALNKFLFVFEFSAILLISLILCENDDGKCLLNGVCGMSKLGPIPCYEIKPHHQYEDTQDTLKILKEDCPELFTDDNTIPEVCCSPDDVRRMQMAFDMYAAPYVDCPSCYDNIKRVACHAHCAPNQNQFMSVIKSEKISNGSIIREMDYYVTDTFMAGWRESCKNMPAFKALMEDGGCNENCSLDDFVRIVGSVGVRLPMQVNMKMSKTGETPTVNGQPGKPADIPFQMCTKNCSEKCPASPSS